MARRKAALVGRGRGLVQMGCIYYREQQQAIRIMLTIIRYSKPQMKTFFNCLFVTALCASMALFPLLKLTYVSELSYHGHLVAIHRDEYNIPTIKAPAYKSALYAWGYVTAEDRLFQMAFRRLIGQGRLAEFLGAKAVTVDKIFRELNMHGWAKRTEQRFKRQNRTEYEEYSAYAEGVNAYARSLRVYPVEFLALGLEWEDWTVSDMFLVFKILKWSQSLTMADEYIRSSLLTNYTKQEVDQILKFKGQDWHKRGHMKHETIVKDDEIVGKSAETISLNTSDFTPIQLKKLVEVGPILYFDTMSKGSNSWVIGGQYTQSGHPLLSNDPHLDSAMPGEWHQVKIHYRHKGRDCSFVGASIVGLPSMIGKATYFAWGLTTIYSDIQDLYKQKIDGDRYFYGGEWRALRRRQEEIKVKNSPSIQYEVRETHHGPILSVIAHRGSIYEIEGDISLTWAGFTDSEFEGMYRVSRCAEISNYAEMKQFFLSNADAAPTMNVVYITKDDHFGYVALGPTPLRRHPHMGMYIKDGTDPKNEWLGFVRGNNRLIVEDPQRGYIVTANNKPASAKYQNGIYDISIQTARADRLEAIIRGQLATGRKLNKQTMKRMQLDTVDGYCLETVRAMEAKMKQDRHKYSKVFSPFIGFDCDFSVNATTAALFLSFFHNVYEQTYPSKVDPKVALAVNLGYLFSVYEFIMDAETEKDIRVLEKALDESWKEMEALFGSRDVSTFTYGKLHRDAMVHRPFSQVKPLAAFFARESDGWGTQNTPNVGVMTKLHEKDFTSTHRANIRTIISYFEDSEWIIDGGNSEQAYIRHYDDQQELFFRGQYLPMDPIKGK